MKRIILFGVLIGLVGCDQPNQAPTAPSYQHSLKAPKPEERIKAIDERVNRYKTKP